jgi:hypothetical protein
MERRDIFNAFCAIVGMGYLFDAIRRTELWQLGLTS